MFKLADPSIIGKYLSKKIDDSKYKNCRQFCKAYLEYNNEKANSDEIRKMQNRIGQIIKGSKGIQLYDLPVFCELLDVTCEELLSAGKSFVQKSDRPTNYSVVFSKDPKAWKEYINREDKLILNQDEYGNTVIDYAIKFKNYGFIKYLIDNKYIWFDGGDVKKYVVTFGADTSIKRRHPSSIDDYFEYYLATEDKLRKEIIALAIINNDISILDELRAREIPSLHYKAHYFSGMHPEIINEYNDNLIEAVINASDEILDYFSNEFKVDDFVNYEDGNKRKHTFVFPFANEMIVGLIKNNNSFAEFVIRKFIEHNENTYNQLKKLISEDVQSYRSQFEYFEDNYRETVINESINRIFDRLYFSEDGNIVSFCGGSHKGLITNIVYCNAESTNPKLKYLIKDLNNLFDKIVNIKSEFIKEEE